MKPIKLSIIGAAFALLIVTAALVNNSFASKTNRSVVGDGFAVLELFTSEGCSSCPPADELLARIQQEAGDRPVYVLAYHVDYWDHQGWKDVFGSSQFSKRQYQYSQQFSGLVYTPQVIVNGKSEFTGGDENAAEWALKKALSAKPNESISLQGQQTGREMKVDFQLEGNTKGNKLMIAVVEKHAVSNVTRGENQGRTLSHAQIVRKLYTFNLQDEKNGSQQFELPEGFNVKDWEIVGFLQNTGSGVINAAGRAKLSSSPVTAQ